MALYFIKSYCGKTFCDFYETQNEIAILPKNFKLKRNFKLSKEYSFANFHTVFLGSNIGFRLGLDLGLVSV